MTQIKIARDSRRLRIAAALVPGLIAAVVFVIVAGPLRQPLEYHKFSDHHRWFGIPHAGDVLSNLAFIIIGAWGLFLLSRPGLLKRAFIDARERRAYWWLFTGVFLTGFGSAWYHLEPDNYSLVWDRLPMALAFMGIFSAMISERIDRSLGIALLGPLLIVGVGSVLWWIWTEYTGHGDLRWYVIVQFYPMIAMVLMLLLLPTQYTRGNDYWWLVLFYAIAKAAELLDHQILDISHGLISGHSFKHLFAALGTAFLLRMLWLRQPR